MDIVDLSFSVTGRVLPLDHAYGLYAAVSRVLGQECHTESSIGIHRICGIPAGSGLMALDSNSRLTFRTPVNRIPSLLALVGKELNVDKHCLRVGVPQTRSLIPAPVLYSRLVTIKGFEESTSFLEAVQRQLDALNIAGHAAIPSRIGGPHAGEPTRRVLRIKDKTVVGFSLVVSDLSSEESGVLLQKGIGGRRRMGCGIFVLAGGAEEA